MEIDQLRVLVAAMIFVGIFAAAGAIALSNMRTSTINSLSPTTVTNESKTLVNATAVQLNNNYVRGVSEVLVNFAGTDWITLNTNEYTLANLGSETVATITLTNISKNNNASRVTYTYLNEDSSVASNVTGNSLSGLVNTSQQFGTAGAIAGVGILLTIVAGALYMFMNRQVQ